MCVSNNDKNLLLSSVKNKQSIHFSRSNFLNPSRYCVRDFMIRTSVKIKFQDIIMKKSERERDITRKLIYLLVVQAVNFIHM